MANQFSSGAHSIAVCDRCGFQYKLLELKEETVKGAPRNNRVCSTCWDEDHPQLMLGMYPVEDPQAVRDARPDTTYAQSRGMNIFVTSGTYVVTQLGRVTVTAA